MKLFDLLPLPPNSVRHVMAKHPDDKITILPLAITNNDRALKDMETTIDRMEKTKFATVPTTQKHIDVINNQQIPQNPTSCDGYFHNSPCHLLDVCEGNIDANTIPTINPLSHYAKL